MKFYRLLIAFSMVIVHSPAIGQRGINKSFMTGNWKLDKMTDTLNAQVDIASKVRHEPDFYRYLIFSEKTFIATEDEYHKNGTWIIKGKQLTLFVNDKPEFVYEIRSLTDREMVLGFKIATDFKILLHYKKHIQKP